MGLNQSRGKEKNIYSTAIISIIVGPQTMKKERQHQ